MMSPQLEDIVRKVRSDERIAPAEALVLWHEEIGRASCRERV